MILDINDNTIDYIEKQLQKLLDPYKSPELLDAILDALEMIKKYREDKSPENMEKLKSILKYLL